MDDLKLFESSGIPCEYCAYNESGLGMEFSLQKGGVLVLERARVDGCERLSYPAGK